MRRARARGTLAGCAGSRSCSCCSPAAAGSGDGFLHFAFEVEVYAGERPAIALVSRMLEALWARGWPAVAACEYEDQLPDRGGRRWRAAPS